MQISSDSLQATTRWEPITHRVVYCSAPRIEWGLFQVTGLQSCQLRCHCIKTVSSFMYTAQRFMILYKKKYKRAILFSGHKLSEKRKSSLSVLYGGYVRHKQSICVQDCLQKHWNTNTEIQNIYAVHIYLYQLCLLALSSLQPLLFLWHSIVLIFLCSINIFEDIVQK